MNNGKFISVKMIADRLMQNPLMKDLNFEFIIDHTVECMRLINMAPIYVSKLSKIEVVNYKADIPIDLIYVNQIFYNKNNAMIPMNSGQDSVHEHYNCLNRSQSNNSDLTYTLNNSKVFTNFENGSIAIAYKAIATDEQCYPLIIDNVKVVRAIESYIKYRWFDILNDMEKVSDRKLNKAEIDYSFNVGQAQSDLVMPDETEMEALVNSITKILPSKNQFGDRMKYLGSQEFLKIH